jgi:arsenate reductase (thioredoxin)
MIKTYNILFLCTGNSARSILGEILATTLSHGKFVGYSAGSKPAGFIHPLAMRIAKELGYALEILRSKSWDEYGTDDAPKMDFIITVCDSAAGEECPYWPGHPTTAHWGFPDPASVVGSDQEKWGAFKRVEIGLRNRIELLMDLSVDQLDHLQIKEELQDIHHRAVN